MTFIKTRKPSGEQILRKNRRLTSDGVLQYTPSEETEICTKIRKPSGERILRKNRRFATRSCRNLLRVGENDDFYKNMKAVWRTDFEEKSPLRDPKL